jgi:hypothetical protein
MANYNDRYDLTAKDILGNVFIFKIRDSQYSGSVVEITCGADPVEIKYDNDEQDIYGAMRKTTMVITLLETNSTLFTVLKKNNDSMRFQTYTFQSGHTNRCYLQTEGYSEENKTNPKLIQFYAYEGFNILNKITLEPFEIVNNRYQKAKLSDVFFYCLSFVPDDSISVRIACNLFEANHVTTTTPLHQTYIDIQSLKFGNDEYGTVFDVLKSICELFGMAIFQARTVWYFIRISEMHKTSLSYREYTKSGTATTNGVINPRILLTGNSVSRGNRIDWVNANTQVYIKPAYRNIKTTVNRPKKNTFYEDFLFQNFIERGLNNIQFYAPEFWDPLMVYVSQSDEIRAVNEENYYIEGEKYYPMGILGNAGGKNDTTLTETQWFGIASAKREILSIDAGKTGLNLLNIDINYAIRLGGLGFTSEDRADVVFRIRLHKVNGSGVHSDKYLIYENGSAFFVPLATAANCVIKDVSNAKRGQFNSLGLHEFLDDYQAGSYIQFTFYKLANYEGGAGTLTPELVIKNIEMNMQYSEYQPEVFLGLDAYVDVEESEDLLTTNSNAFNNNHYNNDLKFGDIVYTNEDEQIAKEYMYRNILYWLDGSTYRPTGIWDYDSKGLNRTIQGISHYDVVNQYSSATQIMNGDIMGADLISYNIFQDDYAGGKIFLPINVVHNIKKCVLSGEFMEIKIPGASSNFLADENDQAILDDQGEEILINF